MIDHIITALIGSACAAFIAGVIALVRWMVYLSRMLKNMQSNGVARREEVKATFGILSILMRANKATLEALRDEKCNGNVTDALKELNEADRIYDDLFLSSIDKRERVTA